MLVDIAVDQGGCFEDTYATTHADPTYTVHESVFYRMANMPGAVPNTSTYALTDATLPYAMALADKGWQQACRDDHSLMLGLSMGHMVLAATAIRRLRHPIVTGSAAARVSTSPTHGRPSSLPCR